MKDSTVNKKPIAPASTEPTLSSSAKPRVAMPEKGTLWKKKGAQAGDPYKQPVGIRAFKGYERKGACYGIRATIPAYVSPEAGATQGNGRLISAAVNRSRPNFQDSVTDSLA